jgi:hypothetical protein
MTKNDLDYHLERERVERMAAAASDTPSIEKIHLDLAERHAACAKELRSPISTKLSPRFD